MCRFFLIFCFLLAAVLAGLAPSWATTSTSGNLPVNVTPAPPTDPNQTIGSVQLSGSSVQFAASGPYYVGTLTTNLSPQTPTFNNLSGASYQLVASGGSCSGGDTTHFQISGDGVYTNTLAVGTYKLCVTASAAGVTPYTATFTGITEGHKIDAAAGVGVSGCAGAGTSGSPWNYHCIQNAVDSAVAGDTVYLAAGNWALNTTDAAPVTVSKAINLIGAGSGNTFSAAGNPSNASGTDLCPNTSPGTVSLTCVAITGPNNTASPTGGQIHYTGPNCSNDTVSHIFFDASGTATAGAQYALLNAISCTGPIAFDDIHILSLANDAVSAESVSALGFVNNVTVQDSIFAAPLSSSGSGRYSVSSPMQITVGNYLTIKNSFFYESSVNPIAVDNVVFTGSSSFQGYDGGGHGFGGDAGFGWAGCGLSSGASCIANGGGNGSLYFTVTNSYLNAPGYRFGVGGGLNDPGTAGGNNALTISGNTIIADVGAVDSCVWHYYNPATQMYWGCIPEVKVSSASSNGSTTVTFVVPNIPSVANIGTPGVEYAYFGTQGFSTGYNTVDVPNAPFTWWTETSNTCVGASCTIIASCNASGQPACPAAGSAGTVGYLSPSIGGSEGMEINGTVNDDCSENSPLTPIFSARNNSIIATTAATIDAAATGIIGCRLGSDLGGALRAHYNTVVNFTAQQNYLSSPNNAYVSSDSSLTVNPSVSNNYGIDVRSGFTTPPTASFTLGLLEEPGGAYDVPFTATNFTAQYGAVKWLASSSPTMPTSGGQSGTGCNGSACSWSYVPPASLAGVTHGQTVYLWVMDSANNISAPASALIP